MCPETAGHLDQREMFLQWGMTHVGHPECQISWCSLLHKHLPFTHTRSYLWTGFSRCLHFLEAPKLPFTAWYCSNFKGFTGGEISGEKPENWRLSPFVNVGEIVGPVLSVLHSALRNRLISGVLWEGRKFHYVAYCSQSFWVSPKIHPHPALSKATGREVESGYPRWRQNWGLTQIPAVQSGQRKIPGHSHLGATLTALPASESSGPSFEGKG